MLSSYLLQVVYFWPGFKSSKPEMGLPVLQPVMQYGQGLSRKWQLQSWFVHGGAVTAKAIALEPGDEVTSIMSYDAASTTFGFASSMRIASSFAAKPPNTTEWTAPMRAQASIPMTASGTIGM